MGAQIDLLDEIIVDNVAPVKHGRWEFLGPNMLKGG